MSRPRGSVGPSETMGEELSDDVCWFALGKDMPPEDTIRRPNTRLCRELFIFL